MIATALAKDHDLKVRDPDVVREVVVGLMTGDEPWRCSPS